MKIFKENKYRISMQFLKFSFVVVLFLSFLFPVIVSHADDKAGITVKSGIENPLGNGLNDIPSFITAIINIVLLVGIPIVTLAIIYSGFLFVQASGNSEKLGTAKKALLYSVVGAALLLGAFVLAEAIKGTVDQLK